MVNPSSKMHPRRGYYKPMPAVCCATHLKFLFQLYTRANESCVASFRAVPFCKLAAILLMVSTCKSSENDKTLYCTEPVYIATPVRLLYILFLVIVEDSTQNVL